MGISVKNKNRLANSVVPDETARYEPSHQELHCLQKKKKKKKKKIFWSVGLKELRIYRVRGKYCNKYIFFITK